MSEPIEINLPLNDETVRGLAAGVCRIQLVQDIGVVFPGLVRPDALVLQS